MKAKNLKRGIAVQVKKHREEGSLYTIEDFADVGEFGAINAPYPESNMAMVYFPEQDATWACHASEIRRVV